MWHGHAPGLGYSSEHVDGITTVNNKHEIGTCYHELGLGEVPGLGGGSHGDLSEEGTRVEMTTEADLTACRERRDSEVVGGVGLSGDEAPEGPGSGFGPGSAKPWGDFHPRSRIYWSLAMGLAPGQTCRVLNLAGGRDRILPFLKWQCQQIWPRHLGPREGRCHGEWRHFTAVSCQT